MGFLEKNLENFQNHSMWQICSLMRLKWYIFLKLSLHLIFGKSQKKIKLRKVRKYDEETEYFAKKKRFLPSKRHL